MDNTLLLRTLADEQELLRATTQTLDAEAQALRDGDMDELERITQTKQKQLAALAEADRERRLWWAQHGGTDPYGLVKYLRSDETASRLFDENLALARLLRQRNTDNGTLIDLRLRATQNALSVLHAANNGGGTPYGRNGKQPLSMPSFSVVAQ
ncbi:flagella synthesis protein FlgN [Ralstonia soli]|uniref:Flagellar protein FlgN n=1 Tax=Ralstonia soli TaxID=2953896 RepID=A0ABT1APJ8_9RALS|nr:flagellar protein FlgN [Ralstonia soli]MCO5400320.1 flagellar protein FlgN [Ralstonia soli]